MHEVRTSDHGAESVPTGLCDWDALLRLTGSPSPDLHLRLQTQLFWSAFQASHPEKVTGVRMVQDSIPDTLLSTNKGSMTKLLC